MSRVHFTKSCVSDLDGILDVISKDRPGTAVRIVEELISVCELLAKSPQLGSSMAHLQMRLRAFSVGSYVIYFRPATDGVVIARIAHGARDASRLFRSRDKKKPD